MAEAEGSLGLQDRRKCSPRAAGHLRPLHRPKGSVSVYPDPHGTHDPWGEGPGAPGRPSFSPGGELRAGQCLLINLLLTGKSCAEVPISSQSEQNFPGMPPNASFPLTPGLFLTPDFIPLVRRAPAKLHWLCPAGLLSPGS